MKILALALTLFAFSSPAAQVRGEVKDEVTLSPLFVASIGLTGQEAEATLVQPCSPPHPPVPPPSQPPQPDPLPRHGCGKKLTLVFDLASSTDQRQYELLLDSRVVSLTLENGQITTLRSLRPRAGGKVLSALPR